MKKLYTIISVTVFVVLAFTANAAYGQEDVAQLLKQLESDSDRFSNSATKALDESKYDGTATEDQLVRFVRDFEDSIDRLKKAHDGGEDPMIPAKEVLARAKVIDKFLKKNDLGAAVTTDWGTVKSDLTRVAAAHKLKTS